MPELDEIRAVLPELSDEQLCRAWRRSFLVLERADPCLRLSVVELRAAYLDEMSRRHPRQLAAWMASGGRAASGPDKYFAEPE